MEIGPENKVHWRNRVKGYRSCCPFCALGWGRHQGKHACPKRGRNKNTLRTHRKGK